MSINTSQEIIGFIKEFCKNELNGNDATLGKIDNLESRLESDLLMDSLSLMDLVGQADSHFNINASSEVDAIGQLSSVRDLVSFIQKFINPSATQVVTTPPTPLLKLQAGPDTTLAALKSPWFQAFVGLKQKPSKIRLFCFYHAGGNPAIFRKWEMTMPESIEVVSVNLPGHQGRLEEKCLTDVREIADRVSTEIVPLIRSGKPFAFFGHSFGTLVAFETAVALRKKYGVSPCVLIVSGRRAPQIEDPFQNEFKSSSLSDTQFIDALSARYQDPNIAKVKDIPDVMSKLLPSMRADMIAFENYKFDIKDGSFYPFDFSLASLAGDSDSRVNKQQLDDWQMVTNGKYHGCKFMKGNHFYILDNAPPLIEEVQKILKASVEGL